MQENRSFDHDFGGLAGVRGFGDRFPIPAPASPDFERRTVWAQYNGRPDDAPGFLRRLAGRIETGAPSTSDPAMGQERILHWTLPA